MVSWCLGAAKDGVIAAVLSLSDSVTMTKKNIDPWGKTSPSFSQRLRETQPYNREKALKTGMYKEPLPIGPLHSLWLDGDLERFPLYACLSSTMRWSSQGELFPIALRAQIDRGGSSRGAGGQPADGNPLCEE